jgi:hypothetical protein
MQLDGSLGGKESHILDIASLEDAKDWMDSITLDEDCTLLWRGCGALFHVDIILGG